jgi:hypothetical protein
MQRLEPHSRLGIDFGGVLIGASTDEASDGVSFLSAHHDAAMSVPPELLAFETVAAAVSRTEGQVHLVSKCSPRVEVLTRAWLTHHRFFDRTGVRRDQLVFVPKRPDKRVVAERLGLTHFVDDRLDVLEAMVGVVPNLLWFGQAQSADARFVAVPDWAAVASRLL